ncbi:dephospho-CoA kinase, partial [Vibrio breoganii]
ANLFNEHFNIDIVDADIVAREVVAVGSDGLKQITDHFGEAILLEDGVLNRSKLRELIFSDPTEKQWLNDLLHPMIRNKIDSDLSKVTSPYALLVAPLLVENQMQGMA